MTVRTDTSIITNSVGIFAGVKDTPLPKRLSSWVVLTVRLPEEEESIRQKNIIVLPCPQGGGGYS